MKLKKVLLYLLCAVMTAQSISVSAASCTFKNNAQEETAELVSGDIYVYAPEEITKNDNLSNVFATADLKMLLNDGTSEAEADASSSVAEKAIDGKTATMARAKEKEWNLELDIKEEKQLESVSVTFGTKFYPTHYRIEAAAEDKEWFIIGEDENNTAGGEFTFDFEKQNIRYVRIMQVVGEKKMGICEVEAYVTGETKAIFAAGLYNKNLDKMCSFETKEITSDMLPEDAYITVNIDEETTGIPAEIPVRENLLTDASARFLSNGSAGELPASGESYAENALDGDLETKACAGGEWAYTFEASMEEAKEIGQIVLYFFEGHYPINYDVIISENGEEWVTVGGEENNAADGKRVFSFETTPVQYIRIRDNIAQTDVRQMGIAEIEAYEKSNSYDYEIRAFLLKSDGKTSYDENVYRLNDEKVSHETVESTENTAAINIDKEISLTWAAEDSEKSLTVIVKCGEETIYFNVFTPEECTMGGLTLAADSLEDGDTVTVTFAGNTDFETELVYDTKAILYDMFTKEFAESSEDDIIDVVKKYADSINSNNLSNISDFSDKETAALKSALLNGTITSFDDAASIIDTAYDDIIKARTEVKKPSSSGGSSGSSSSGGGGISARMDASSAAAITVPQPENKYEYEKEKMAFKDLENAEWAKESIDTLWKKGVINGTSEETFSPDDNVTRGQFVKMLVIAFDAADENAECDFEDISKENWAYPYVASAYKAGLVNGITENYFGVNENITRQDAAVMVYRFVNAYGNTEITGEAMGFFDKSDIADYAVEAVDFMSANGIMNGVGEGNFDPNGNCTRAMAAKIICMAAYGEGNQ